MSTLWSSLLTDGRLFGWPKDFWIVADQLGILLGYIVPPLLLLWGWFRREKLRRWFSTNHFPKVGGEAAATSWDALVFTVSKSEVPKWVIDQCRPRAVGLIASAQSEQSARDIGSHAGEAGIRVLDTRIVVDAKRPGPSRAETQVMIDMLRKAGHERIGVDVTGGTLPMSLGAFMAAEENNCNTLYVAHEYGANGVEPGSQELTYVSRMPNDQGA